MSRFASLARASFTDQQYPPGWLTRFRHGVGSGAVLLLIALGCCALPSYAAWLMPGTDSTSALSALKAAALVLLSAGHGGVVLAGTPVTLAPLLVTSGLGWLVAGHARRQGSWSGFAGLAVGYTASAAVLAGWSRLGSTHAPVLRSTVAALLFVVAVGAIARSAGELRAGCRPDGGRSRGRQPWWLPATWWRDRCCRPACWSRTSPTRWRCSASSAPGAAGLPVALLGVSAAPNAVLAGVGFLTGPGFHVGTSTSVSAFGMSSGRLPVFPLLAGLPHRQPAAWLAVLAILVPALLAGWAVLRILPSARSWIDRLADCAAAAALAGLLLALLTGLAGGDLGRDRLRGIGAHWWAVGLGTALLVLLAAAFWLGIEATARPARRLGRPALYALRPEPDSDAADDGVESDRDPAPSAVREPAHRSRTAS